MIAAGMENKRLGLAQKSLYVVLSHLLEQWGSDFFTIISGSKYSGGNEEKVLTGTENGSVQI